MVFWWFQREWKLINSLKFVLKMILKKELINVPSSYFLLEVSNLLFFSPHMTHKTIMPTEKTGSKSLVPWFYRCLVNLQISKMLTAKCEKQNSSRWACLCDHTIASTNRLNCYEFEILQSLTNISPVLHFI